MNVLTQKIYPQICVREGTGKVMGKALAFRASPQVSGDRRKQEGQHSALHEGGPGAHGDGLCAASKGAGEGKGDKGDRGTGVRSVGLESVERVGHQAQLPALLCAATAVLAPCAMLNHRSVHQEHQQTPRCACKLHFVPKQTRC